jgi:dihydrodipicolinate synthase/N-acetylneuraminate lyase
MIENIPRIRPGRRIEGISAILLPFEESGMIDFAGFIAHIERTYAAGLLPAFNMDTGYTNLLTRGERAQLLAVAQETAGGRPFVAGAFMDEEMGDLASIYTRETEEIQVRGGTPILFPCSALKRMEPDEIIAFYRTVAAHCEKLLAFELGEMFASFGQIYTLDVVQALMETPQITGMKHSSLKRGLEWQRLMLRDSIRPDFKIYTGNDLAIDMVMYGSDYLLGLSTFAPDYFAKRDAYWAAGNPAFYELNDVLQYLGQFAFRAPVSAYKHNAAQFLKLRGWLKSDTPHRQASRRPDTDVAVLRGILEHLKQL